jgi:hypothetical protein
VIELSENWIIRKRLFFSLGCLGRGATAFLGSNSCLAVEFSLTTILFYFEVASWLSLMKIFWFWFEPSIYDEQIYNFLNLNSSDLTSCSCEYFFLYVFWLFLVFSLPCLWPTSFLPSIFSCTSFLTSASYLLASQSKTLVHSSRALP